MIGIINRRFGLVAYAILGVATVGACGRGAEAAGDTSLAQMLRSAASDNADSPGGAGDPCTLLSGAEASKYIGNLATPAYRATDSGPNVRGDVCIYRSRDGRVLRISQNSGGGDFAGTLEDVPKKLGAALSQHGAKGADTMANRVMQQVPKGSWDKVTWIPGGSLFATKGDGTVVIDVSGASGKQSDALAIATTIFPRIGHPLAYNGASAVALVPKAPAHPANACDVVSRAEVEAAIGTLAGAPTPDSTGSGCTYRVETSHGTRNYPVEYVWHDGARNFNAVKHSMATVSGLMKVSGASALDSLKPTGQMGEMMGGLMKMVTGGSMTTAPGAVATVGFKNDTTLTGPWDSAMLYHGTQLMATRHDAMVTINLTSADYEHSKALLAAISRKL
jgi:hypothetical protein